MRLIMGMPVVVEIVDKPLMKEDLEKVFQYFTWVDDKFSTFKDDSEVMRLNHGEITESEVSPELQEVLKLSEETKLATQGFFDIRLPGSSIDPSGLVKGWAIRNAAKILDDAGYQNFYVEAGGDVEVRGHNADDKKWRIGIKNPFNKFEIVKVLYLGKGGVATSGTYEKGQHIYNPHMPGALEEILSLTVIADNVYEADRFATAAFAMGLSGIHFIENLAEMEGYMIDKEGIATETTGFSKYTHE